MIVLNEILGIFERNKETYLNYLKNFIAVDTQTIGHGIKGGNEKNGQLYLEKLFNELGAYRIEKEYLDDEILNIALKKYNEGNLGHNNKDRYNSLVLNILALIATLVFMLTLTISGVI